MEVIPVLDLMEGCVVRGVAGRRESYAPVQSALVDSSAPRDVARAFRHELELSRIYVADLDAIVRDAPQWDVLSDLAADGIELLVDAGLRESARAECLIDCGVRQVVAALETLPGPQSLRELLSRIGPERVVFSLDLMQGKPLGAIGEWKSNDPLHIARRAIELGVASLIVLDLSSVGVDSGVPTHELCRRLRRDFPHLTLIGGGGVRHLSDLVALRESGFNGALVASALHVRRIGRAEIVAVSTSTQYPCRGGPSPTSGGTGKLESA